MTRAEEIFALAKDMERHLPRTANDAIAMEAASLFMQEFMRGRSGAFGDLEGMLLWGVWPRHPYDDAVTRLRALFARCCASGGSLENAVETAVEMRAETKDAPDELLRPAAEKAVRDAAAEAIGGTACAWAHDAHWSAADFAPIQNAFDSERMRRMNEGHLFARLPLDDCGGVGCCLDLAAFLFSTHYAVAPWTPANDGPFMWSKEDYERFASSMACSQHDKALMRAFANEVPAALFDAEEKEFLHPCLFRDPFELALDMADSVAPGVRDAFAQDGAEGEPSRWTEEAGAIREYATDLAYRLGIGSEEALGHFAAPSQALGLDALRCALGLLTCVCCLGSGREEPLPYCQRRLGA